MATLLRGVLLVVGLLVLGWMVRKLRALGGDDEHTG
jgi:hypothetical protein